MIINDLFNNKPIVSESRNDIVNSLVNLRATVKQIQTGRAEYPEGFASQLEIALYDAINALRDSKEQGVQNTVNELAELRAIAKQVQSGKIAFPQGYTGHLEWVLYDTITQIENSSQGVAEANFLNTLPGSHRDPEPWQMRNKEFDGLGGQGYPEQNNDLYSTGRAAPSYIKQQLKARREKGGVAGPKGHLPEQGMAEGLNEFARDDDDREEGPGDDPYKYPKPQRYASSIDFFSKFEADHFDHEDFDDATGIFKGYWDYDGSPKQIAYFKFDNPQRTSGDDPGMGWYYEPESNGNSDTTSTKPAVDNSEQRKQQELGMIRAFLKSGNRPNPNSQIGRLMKKYGMAEASLGDYRKKATVNKAMAQTNRFFDRDDPAKVAAADQTIAKREKGLARADARVKPYTPPPAAPADLEKQQRDLTAKYPNIDELVRRAELNRDPNYEMADGQAYYAARDAEQNYQKLRQIQRVIQGLNESLDQSHLP